MMDNNYLRKENESILDYAERLLLGKEEGVYDLDKTEIYSLLYGAQVSSDHARKALKVIEMTIEQNKKLNDIIQIHEDLNDKDLIEENIKKNYKETIEFNKDGTQSSDKLIEMSEEQAKDVNFLLKSHGYKIEDWELISARNNIWNVYSKKDGVKTLYSSKIVIKPRENNISMEELQKHFEEFSKNFKSITHKPSNYKLNSRMLEVQITDLHLGKLAFSNDSGENYNTSIAKERYFYIINDIINQTKDCQFEKILFVWSNDFFNFDTIDGTTTAGTKQNSDTLWKELYKTGIEMLVEGIDLLSQIAPVETFYLSSNHDKMISFYATMYLHAWFKDNKNVFINIDAKSRKYIEFGKCLIGFSHGNSEKKRIGTLMPIEAREAWGRTLFHEFHAAHFHSEKAVVEENGVIVRYISSPTSTDSWHYETAYVGAIKKAQHFIWDKENGLINILHTPINPEINNTNKD